MNDYDVVWNEETGEWEPRFSGPIFGSDDFPVEKPVSDFPVDPAKIPVKVTLGYLLLLLLGLCLLPIGLLLFMNALVWVVGFVAGSVTLTWAVCGAIIVALGYALYRNA